MDFIYYAMVWLKEEKFYIEGIARVKAKVWASILCGCGCEGDLGLTVPRDIKKPINIEDSSSFLRFSGFDGDCACLQVKPNDWVDAKIWIFGDSGRVDENKVVFNSSFFSEREEIKKVGCLRIVEKEAFVDFDFFRLRVTDFNRNRAVVDELKSKGFKDGDYLDASKAALYLYLYHFGTKEEIISNTAKIFVPEKPGIAGLSFIPKLMQYPGNSSRKAKFLPEKLVEQSWFKRIVKELERQPTTVKQLSKKTNIPDSDLKEYLKEMELFPAVRLRELEGENDSLIWLHASTVHISYEDINEKKLREKDFQII